MGGNASKQEQTSVADDNERLKAARIAMEKVNKYISEKSQKGGLTFINLSMQGIAVLPNKLLEHKETLSQLDLSMNRVENLDSLQELDNLKFLNLSQNNLGCTPSQVFSRKTIQSLVLSGNKITEISEDFQCLENLLKLDMKDNHISLFNPILKLCTSLNVLNLSFNYIPTIPPDFCLNVKNLERLALRNNRITVIPPEIGLLSSLTSLELTDNNIKVIPPEIGNLTKLTTLYLDINELEEVCPELSNLKLLKELNLNTNNLRFLPKSIGSLRSLEKLDLGNNPWLSKEYEDDNIMNILDFLENKPEEIEKREAEDKSIPNASKELRVAQVYRKKLYRFSGFGTDISVVLVDPMLCNLNIRNSFILNSLGKTYAWIGRKSNAYCRDKAINLAKDIENESHGCSKIIDYKAGLTDDDDFWEDLGEKGEVSDEVMEEEESFSTVVASFTLHIAQEKNDRVTFEVVKGDNMSKLHLISANCAVLDDTKDVWIWKGSNSTDNQKSFSVLKAEELFGKGTRPKCAEIRSEMENSEHVLFREHFYDWTDNKWILSEDQIEELETAKREEELREREEEEEVMKEELLEVEERDVEIEERDIETEDEITKEKEKEEEEEEENGNEIEENTKIDESIGENVKEEIETEVIEQQKELVVKEVQDENKEVVKEVEETTESVSQEQKTENTEKVEIQIEQSVRVVEEKEKGIEANALNDGNSGKSSEERLLRILAEKKRIEEKKEEERRKAIEEKRKRQRMFKEREQKILEEKRLAQLEAEKQSAKENEINAIKTEVIKEEIIEDKKEDIKEVVEKKEDIKEITEEKKKDIKEVAEKKEDIKEVVEEKNEKVIEEKKEDIKELTEEKKEDIKEVERKEEILIDKKEDIKVIEKKDEIIEEKKEIKVDAKKQPIDESKATENKTAKTSSKLATDDKRKSRVLEQKKRIEEMFGGNKETQSVPIPKPAFIPQNRASAAPAKTTPPSKQTSSIADLAKDSQPKQSKVFSQAKKIEEMFGGRTSAPVQPTNETQSTPETKSEQNPEETKHIDKIEPKAAMNKRRKPTKNPLRERKDKDSSTENRPQASEASKISGIVGGYGVLYSVKADNFLFSKSRDVTDSARKTLEQDRNLDPRDLPRLFLVKGRKRPFVKQVELSWKSFNSGDCFVVDPGKKGKAVYQWNGKDSNRIKRGKAMDFAKNMKDKERLGAKLEVISEGSETAEFWESIGGLPEGAKIAGKEVSGDDEEAEKEYPKCVVLYKAIYTDEKTEIQLERAVEEGKHLYKGMLENGVCYILDCVSEVYAWTSMKAPIKYRSATVKKAQEIVRGREGSHWIFPMYHERPGSEQVIFKERFADWNTIPIAVQAPERAKKTQTQQPQQKVDVAAIYNSKDKEMNESMIDDGSGKVKIFLVNDFKRVELPEESIGEFYSGESYVIIYFYVWKNKDCHILYYWQGKNSTIIGKGTSAALTIELDDLLKKTASMSKEIRVVQGKEPKHFLAIFKDKFVVHSGKDPLSDDTVRSDTKPRMYRVQGERPEDVWAVETKMTSELLNSSHVFCVLSPKDEKVYIWNGKYSNPSEHEYAKKVVAKKSKEPIEVEEGNEPNEFWTLIGGKKEYATQASCVSQRYEPRLFQCSISSGTFTVEEIRHFTQDDLDHGDAVILDTFFAVYVWVGFKSHPTEYKLAMETAIEYTKYAATVDKRDVKTPVLRVKDGEEPLVFSTYFQDWEPRAPKKGVAPAPQTMKGGLEDVKEILEVSNRKYSYNDLVNKKYPPGLDESTLENYLEDNEFVDVFKMPRENFEKLPSWQKLSMKKKLKLF